MAEEVRRQVVSDPLAQQVRGQTPDRSLPMIGMGSHQTNGNAVYQQNIDGLQALSGIRQAVAKVQDAQNDENIVTGKMQFMTGMTEQDMLKHGDKYTQQGYEALSSVDKANTWFNNELEAIDSTTREMDPKDYQKYLMEKRKDALSNLPNDPAIKKLYVAAFEQLGPRLADEQFKAHNGLNRTKNINALSDATYSSAGANEDASRVMPGGPLRVSPGVVSPQVQTSADDRDAGIRTMLGEAGGEGELGMAAVAHVLKNRAIDGGYGGASIYKVAHAPNQFTAWNNGPGGIPGISKYKTDSAAYLRAGKVYDAVMSGHNADPTNGATHYYSPQGMKALVAGGSQSNLVPHWWNAESAKNSVTIGHHKFGGKARNLDGFQPHLTAHDAEHERDLNLTSAAATSEASGIPVTHQPGASQIRQLYDASTLRDEDKAAAATDAMVRGFETGSDQVYTDLGGEGFLRKLGATDAQINAVQSAQAKQIKARQDKFDVDAERQTEDFKSLVRGGHFKTMDEVIAGVSDLQHSLHQDEAWSHSLAKEVLTDWHKNTDDEKALNPQLASDLAGVQRLMDENPDYTPEEASKAAQMIGQYYDVDGKTVQGWVVDMWRRDGARKDKLITTMKTEKEKTDKENLVKAQVDTALKGDSGLGAIKGEVRSTDSAGNEKSISAQQYGVKLLKDQETTNARNAVAAGKVNPDNAEVVVNKTVYEKLAKQGVVDTEHGAELEGALKGDIVDASGKVSPGAIKAFDFWLQMTRNPNVGGAYMAQMVTNTDVRELLTSASKMYDDRGNIEEALRKAQLRISQKDFKPEQAIVLNDKFQQQIGVGVDAAVANTMWPGWFHLSPYDILGKDQQQVQLDRGQYREDIIRRANSYHAQNPKVDPAAHIRMAVEDFQNDAVVVSGNLLLGKSSEGKRLDQVMGLESYSKGGDRTAPQRALTDYMDTFGKDLFPNLIGGVGNEARGTGWRGGIIPDPVDKAQYNFDYNQDTGVIEVQLWKDANRTEFIGKPQILHAKTVGDYWIENQKNPGMLFNAIRATKEFVAEGVKNSPNGVPGDGGDGWTLGDLNPFK